MITPPSSPPRLAKSELDRSFVQGLAWTGLSKWGTQLLAWASTLIVARILTPKDYGIVTIGGVYLGLLTLISEFGVGTAVVTLRELSGEQIAELNGFAILLGLAGFGFTLVLSSLLGRFFSSPELPRVLVVMAAGFIITSFQSVPAALLQRDLQFRTLAAIDGIRGLSLSAATVVFAVLGLHYWTLVFGALLSSALGTLLVLWNRRHTYSWPKLQSLQAAIQFSWHVLVSRLSWYVYSNADFVVAGRTLGQVGLGAYTMAWTLANVPVEKIATLIGGVAPAFFSAVQTDKAALRRYFLNLTEIIALTTFPLSIGLALEVRPIVLLILGSKWESAIMPLRLLSIYAAMRCLAPLVAQIITTTRDTRFGMQLSFLSVIAFPPAFYFGSRWGAAGIAAVWIVLYPILNVPLYHRVLRNLELPLGGYLKPLLPALEGSAIMVAGVIFVKHLHPSGWGLVLSLTAETLTGAALYISTIAVLHRPRIETILRQLRNARKSAVS